MPEGVVLLVFEQLRKLEGSAHILFTELITSYFRLIELLIVQLSVLDCCERFEESLKQGCCVDRKSEVLHLQESRKQILQVRLLKLDRAERGAALLDKLITYLRLFNGKSVLDAAEDSNVDVWSTSKNLLQLFLISELNMLVRFFFAGIAELIRSILLMNELNFLQ